MLMLSDAIHEMRQRVQSGDLPDDTAGIVLTLRAFELEARNMEERLAMVSGRPHVALDGRLVTSPIIDIATSKLGVRV
jgi:hypothetical protein